MSLPGVVQPRTPPEGSQETAKRSHQRNLTQVTGPQTGASLSFPNCQQPLRSFFLQ